MQKQLSVDCVVQVQASLTSWLRYTSRLRIYSFTMFYHVRVTLLCTQCLYMGIYSLTLSLPLVTLDIIIIPGMFVNPTQHNVAIFFSGESIKI